MEPGVPASITALAGTVAPTEHRTVRLLAVMGLVGATGTVSAAVATSSQWGSPGTAAYTAYGTAPYQGPGSEGRLAAYLSFFVAGLVFLGSVGRVGLVLRHHSPSWAAPLLLLCPVLGFGISLAGGSLVYGMAITTAVLAMAADAIARTGRSAQTGASEPATGSGA